MGHPAAAGRKVRERGYMCRVVVVGEYSEEMERGGLMVRAESGRWSSPSSSLIDALRQLAALHVGDCLRLDIAH